MRRRISRKNSRNSLALSQKSRQVIPHFSGNSPTCPGPQLREKTAPKIFYIASFIPSPYICFMPTDTKIIALHNTGSLFGHRTLYIGDPTRLRLYDPVYAEVICDVKLGLAIAAGNVMFASSVGSLESLEVAGVCHQLVVQRQLRVRIPKGWPHAAIPCLLKVINRTLVISFKTLVQAEAHTDSEGIYLQITKEKQNEESNRA